MTGWIIFASILAFFLLIFLMPAVLDFRYEEQKVHMRVTYFWIPLFDTDKPKKEKPEKPKKPKKEKQKKKDAASDPDAADDKQKKKEKGKRTLSEWITLGKMLLHSVLKGLRRLFKGIRITNVHLDIRIGSFDAADCALAYGKMCAVVSNGIGFLQQFFRMKLQHVHIAPCFGAEHNTYTARFRVKLSPASVLAAGLSLGLSFAVQWLRNALTAKDKDTKKQNQKSKSNKPLKEDVSYAGTTAENEN